MNSDKRADSLGKTRNYHPLYMISILQTLKLLKLQGLHMLVCYTANCIISAVRRCSGGSLHRRPSIEHPPKSISPASTEDLLAKIIQQGPLRTFQRRLFTPRASMPAIHRSIHSANLPYWAPTNCRPWHVQTHRDALVVFWPSVLVNVGMLFYSIPVHLSEYCSSYGQ